MKPLLTACLLVCLHIAVCAQETYFPPLIGATWETTSSSELGWCDAQIDVLYDFLETESTKSFILLKDGRMVLEKYFGTYTGDSVWFWFSAGKSLTAVLTGIAQEQGMLNIGDQTSTYLGPGWTSLTSAQEDRITIENQLTMTTGLDELDFSCTDPECLTYFANAGERWIYHNAPYSLLRKVVEQATGEDYNDFTKTSITNKTGMLGSWIKSGYNSFFVSRARDMARFGLLVMNKGIWNTTPVLSDEVFLNQMIAPSQALNPSYGYLWWLNGQATHITPDSPSVVNSPIAPDAPMDIYTAAGFQGQYISISPEQDLVMIRQGTSGDEDKAALTLLNEIWAHIGNLECAVTSLPTSVEQADISIFPNPASAYIQLQTASQPIRKIAIFDAAGKAHEASLIDGQIDIRAFQPGLFTIKLTTATTTEFLKFIKR